MIAQAGRIALLIIALVAAGCASGPPPQEAAHGQSVGQRAAAVALDQVGVRYRSTITSRSASPCRERRGSSGRRQSRCPGRTCRPAICCSSVSRARCHTSVCTWVRIASCMRRSRGARCLWRRCARRSTGPRCCGRDVSTAR